jgi:hypothetical protein
MTMSWRPTSAGYELPQRRTRDTRAPQAYLFQRSDLLDAGTGLIASGFTVVTNVTKHRAPMANMARLQTSFISVSIHFHSRRTGGSAAGSVERMMDPY